MNRTTSICLCSVALLFCAAMPGFAQLVAGRDYVGGEALVKFRATPKGAQLFSANPDLVVRKNFSGLSRRTGKTFVSVKSRTKSAEALVAELKANPNVEAVSLNYLRHYTARLPGNDPDFGSLWGLRNTGQVVNGSGGAAGADIRWTEAMRLAQPTGDVVVAVIDTGVQYEHDDLRANMWTNPNELPGNTLDDDGNGYADDVHGYDFSDGDADPMDDSEGHGTHVAGTIAATWNNATGIVGVCVQARIMALKIFSGANSATDEALIEAIDYATTMKLAGVPIAAINASLGGGSPNSLLANAIADAGAAGIVFCAAAGNNGSNNDSAPYYPAGFNNSNIISVAASDSSDNLASFSNYGATTVDMAAPGVNILSDWPFLTAVRWSATDHDARIMEYSPDTLGIVARAYDCGLGYATSFPAAVSGNIALIQRGDIFFSEKVSNAIAAHAWAAVIYNHSSGNFNGTLGGPATNWITTLAISLEDGLELLSLVPTNIFLFANTRVTTARRFNNGTSMATPHVAGAVALLALAFPNDSVTQRIHRILSRVKPLLSLSGLCRTGGRLDLASALDTDGDTIGDWWEERYATNLVAINEFTDADSDGSPDAEEFRTGTDPQDAALHFRVAGISAASPTNVVIRWEGAPGRLYNLRRSTNAFTMGTGIVTGIPASLPMTAMTNVVPPGEAAFYHLELDY